MRFPHFHLISLALLDSFLRGEAKNPPLSRLRINISPYRGDKDLPSEPIYEIIRILWVFSVR